MSAADVIAIQQLISRYNHAADTGDGAAFAGTFVDDGVMNIGGTDVATGRDALAAVGAGTPTAVPGSRHWVNNSLIDVDGDAATHRGYFIVHAVGNPMSVVVSGKYHDQLVRTGDGWRFARRDVTMDG
jgi:uncharacterized protein (TIGR02246 family)